jgi:hypothetical protein
VSSPVSLGFTGAFELPALSLGMMLQNDAGHNTRVLALEFLSPRDIAAGEVTILLERTDPSPVQPQALLTATSPPT